MNKKLHHFLIFTIIVVLTTVLCSCQMKPRSQNDFPSSLRYIYFSPEKPYSPLSVNIKLLFHSMQVTLVQTTSQSPYSFIISNDHFSYNRADVVNANLPTTMNYTQTATIAIQNNRTQKIIASNNFQTTQSLTLNANQIYTTNANELMQQTLNHEMTSLIYYWLTSTNIKNTLDHERIIQ